MNTARLVPGSNTQVVCVMAALLWRSVLSLRSAPTAKALGRQVPLWALFPPLALSVSYLLQLVIQLASGIDAFEQFRALPGQLE